jgi:hypothetical protein
VLLLRSSFTTLFRDGPTPCFKPVEESLQKNLQFKSTDQLTANASCQRLASGAAAEGEILWQTSEGVRCTSTRRAAGASVEITITHGDKVLTKVAFRRDENATAFATAALGEPEGPTVRDRRARQRQWQGLCTTPAEGNHETYLCDL